MDKNQKDQHILEEFVHIHCVRQHTTSEGELCADCQDLLSYAIQRLQQCPLDPKPACKYCEIHCYKPVHREKIREVMRYSGKRLILHGRLDLFWHYLS